MKQFLRSLLGKKKLERLDKPCTPIYQPVQPKTGSTSAAQTPAAKNAEPQKSDSTDSTAGAKPTTPQGNPQARSSKDVQSKDRGKQASAPTSASTKPASATASEDAGSQPAAKPAQKENTRPSTVKPRSNKDNSSKSQQAKAAKQSSATKSPARKPAEGKTSAAQPQKPQSPPRSQTQKQPQPRTQEKKPQRKPHEPVQQPRRGASFSATSPQSSRNAAPARAASPKPAAKPSVKDSMPSEKKAPKKPDLPTQRSAQAKAASTAAKTKQPQPAAAAKNSRQPEKVHKPCPQKATQADTAKPQNQPQVSTRKPGASNQNAAPKKPKSPAPKKPAAKADNQAQSKKQPVKAPKEGQNKPQPKEQRQQAKPSAPQDKVKKKTQRRPQVKPSDISRGLARKSQQVGTPTPAQQKSPRAAQKPKAKPQTEKPQPAKQPKPAQSKNGSKAASPGAGKSTAAGAAAASAASAKDKKAPQTKPQPAVQKPAAQDSLADAKSKYPLQQQAKDPEALATPPESKVVKKKRHARLRQVKGLDGLRGLAVIAVVLYHFFPSLLPGGYLGVDLFFVLSGFLITSLLVREFQTSGGISLKDFWVRRFRRILPAAVSVLVMCTALVAWIGGDLAVGLRQQFLGTLFFVNNWTQIATSQSYFADNEVQVFAHYWSLAVEEQFYVIWPLLITGVFLISRRKPRRLPILVSSILSIASAVAMALIFVPGEDPTRVYYGTDTHAFGLLTGAVLSLLMTSTKSDPKADSWAAAGKAESRIAGVIGALALIGYGAQLFLMPDDAEFTYRGGLFLTSVLGVLMVWGVVREYGPMTPLFRTKVMRWFGQRSFSLYLWHWPVIMMLKALFEGNQNSDKSWILGLVAVPISLLLSEVSYQFIENPFRRGGYKKTWKTYWSSRPGFSELRDGFGKTMWPVVPFLVIASIAGVVYGVINSNDKTELEQQLEQLQQQNQSSNNAPALPNSSAPQSPVEDKGDKDSKGKKTRPMPQGKDITAVGDSVMLASSDALKQRFPQIYVDADVSRHYTAGIQVLQQLKDSGQLRSTVFLGFGTNGPAFPDQIKEALDIIGKDHTVVMAVPYGDREWISQSQQDVLDAAKEYDNVYVADWCGHAQEDPAILYSDGVHPLPERTGEYSDAFYEALKKYSNYDKTVSSQCVSQ